MAVEHLTSVIQGNRQDERPRWQDRWLFRAVTIPHQALDGRWPHVERQAANHVNITTSVVHENRRTLHMGSTL